MWGGGFVSPPPRKFVTSETKRIFCYENHRASGCNNNDDGSEKGIKKMNLRPFKLNCVYLEALNSLNVGDFSRS